MKHVAQLDSHPEAESLNAFAEDALPAAERQLMLAHLAACSHCRQIVFLATDAANESPIPQPYPALQTKANRSPWITNWSIPWAIGAACAAVLTIAILLPRMRRSPDAQLAKVTSTSGDDASAHASSRARQAIPATQPAQPQMAIALPPAITAKAAKTATRSALATLPKASTKPIIPPSGKVDVTIVSPTAGVAKGSRIAPHEFDAAVLPQPALPLPSINAESKAKPATTVALAPSLTISAAQLSNGGSAFIKLPEGSAAAPSASPTASRSFAKRAVGGASPMLQIHNAAGAMPSPQSMTVNGPLHIDLPTLDTDAARRFLYTQLPNGSTAISTAAAQHHLIALDANGALFRSEDYGATWEAVAPQWTGRALQVHINSSPGMSPNAFISVTPCRTCTANKTAPSSTAPIFEILTDSVSTWTSIDGKTWKAK